MINSTERINKIKNDIIKEVTGALHDKVHQIILYGSYARGDYNNESDMDIMILSNTDYSTTKTLKKSVSKVASQVSLENDIEVSMLIRDKTSFESQCDDYPFYRNIITEGVSIYG